MLHEIQADLQPCDRDPALNPPQTILTDISLAVDFLGLRKLARARRASLLKLSAIGPGYADCIQVWQQDACFGSDARLVGDMIRQPIPYKIRW